MQSAVINTELKKFAIPLPSTNLVKVEGIIWNNCIDSQRLVLQVSQYANYTEQVARIFSFMFYEVQVNDVKHLYTLD